MLFKNTRAAVSYKTTMLIILSACLALASATAARAEPLGLSPTGSPDITSGNLVVNYSYDPLTYTGHLTAHDGQWESILDNTCYADNGEGNNTFSLDAWIDSTGHAYCGGSTMSIMGDLWNEDFSDYLVAGPTLLTGSLSAFGFSGLGELEFVFDVTGGNMKSSEYFPDKVGVLLHNSGSNGNWTQSFGVSTATSDLFNTVYVPEPSCWLMLLTLGVGGWMTFRRHPAF